jgi:hypothetical protein
VSVHIIPSLRSSLTTYICTDATPETVKSPIGWVGASENVWLLRNLQFSWRKILAKESWFAPYAETKTSASKSSMTLRRRKQPQQSVETAVAGTSADAVNPSPRKTRRTTTATHAVADVAPPTRKLRSATVSPTGADAPSNPSPRKRRRITTTTPAVVDTAPEAPPTNEPTTTTATPAVVDAPADTVDQPPRKRPRTRKIIRAASKNETQPATDEPKASTMPSDLPQPTVNPESTVPKPSVIPAVRQSERQKERRAKKLVITIPDARTRSESLNATSEGSTAVAGRSARSTSTSTTPPSDTTVVGGAGKEEEKRKKNILPQGLTMVTRGSARRESKKAEEGKTTACGRVILTLPKTRARSTAAPYTTDKVEQIANGRGKGAVKATGSRKPRAK